MEPALSLRQMISFMRLLETYDRWFFAYRDLAQFVGRQDYETVQKELDYYIDADLIEHVGEDIYAYRNFLKIPWNSMELLVHSLRPGCINYLSFEYMLNEYSIISQIPVVMTVATTGESRWYRSKSYSIEFIHVGHGYSKIFDNTMYTTERGINVASPVLAVEDLETADRNLDLIEYDEIEEAQRLYESQQAEQNKYLCV